MFGLSAFNADAFNYLKPTRPTMAFVEKRGGIGRKHKESIKKSARTELKEYLATVFDEPVAQDLKEDVKEYIKPSQGLSIHSINYGKLAHDVELVQRIIEKANAIQQEQEDEALLLMML